MKKPRVLFDTNMLMLFGKGINIFDQIEELLLSKPEYYVLNHVVYELERISREGGVKERKAARLALEVVEKRCRVIDVEKPSNRGVDDLIIEVAVKEGFIVATCDRELRRRLRKRGVPEIYFREEKMGLEIQGYI